MAKTILPKVDCRPIKEQIRAVEGQIRDIDDALGDPDIPPPVKKRLREQLKKLKLLLRRLVAAYEACQAQARP
jgi:hypothetical protein